MLITGLILGSGSLYLGLRVYQQSRQATPFVEKLVTDSPSRRQKWLSKRRGVLLTTGAVLLIGLGGVGWWIGSSGVTPLSLTNAFIQFVGNTPYSPLLYLAIYAVRPLILFPSTLLTLAGGLLFGPVGGLVYSTIGLNLSAMVAYGVGRQLRRVGQTSPKEASAEPSLRAIEPYMERLQQYPFTTVLTMRLLLIPFDWVNYGAGLLRIPWQPFLLATAIGSVPISTSLVLAGASIQGSSITGLPTVNPVMLTTSGVILVGSVAISRYINRRQPIPPKPFLTPPASEIANQQ